MATATCSLSLLPGDSSDDELLFQILKKFSKYSNLFSVKRVVAPDQHYLNNHIIELIKSKKPLFRLFYNLLTIELAHLR